VKGEGLFGLGGEFRLLAGIMRARTEDTEVTEDFFLVTEGCFMPIRIHAERNAVRTIGWESGTQARRL